MGSRLLMRSLNLIELRFFSYGHVNYGKEAMKVKLSKQSRQFAESVLITSMCGVLMILGIEFVMTFA